MLQEVESLFVHKCALKGNFVALQFFFFFLFFEKCIQSIPYFGTEGVHYREECEYFDMKIFLAGGRVIYKNLRLAFTVVQN